MSDSKALSISDVSRMRDAFEEKLYHLYHQKKRLACYEWRDRKWIHRTIHIIDNYINKPRILIQKAGALLAKKYAIDVKNGERIIRMKTNINQTLNLQILPMDEYFDALYEAHTITAHGDRNKMNDYFRNEQVYMPLSAMKFFINLCKVCVKPRTCKKKPSLPLKHTGFVELIDMRNYADGEYKYIMHFKDMTTDCTFLRPLRSAVVVDVAEELLKLFLQIGCPGIIHTPIEQSFTDALVQRLTLAWPNCLILAGRSMKFMKKITGIKPKVQKWMLENSSDKWTMGIFFVANQMNLSKRDEHGSESTPFKKLLGKNPRMGLNTRRLQIDFKDIKREEDLVKINYVDYSDESSESSDSGKESEAKSGAREVAVDVSLPGPSHEGKGVARTVVEKPQAEESVAFHVKHLPTKTYTKKSKTQAPGTAQNPLESSIDEDTIKTEAASPSNPKKKANSSKRQIPTNEAGPSKRALCVDGNLKGISSRVPVNDMHKRLLQSWSNEEIDLPDGHPKDRFGNDLDLTVKKEDIFQLSDGFGKADLEIDPSSMGSVDTGRFLTPSVFPNEIKQEYTSASLDEDPDLPTIVKVESLAENE